MASSYPYSSELETMPSEFRFRPRDYEIIEILKREEWKSSSFITYLDIYDGLDPSILKEQYGTSRSDELYFVTHLTKRYKRGPRPLRSGPHGHWKPGAPVIITKSGKPTNGIRRTLTFHKGPNRKGEKSEWRMHEFSLIEPITDNPLDPNKLGVVLCKMYKCKCASIKEEPKLQIEYADGRNVKRKYKTIKEKDESRLQLTDTDGLNPTGNRTIGEDVDEPNMITYNTQYNFDGEAGFGYDDPINWHDQSPTLLLDEVIGNCIEHQLTSHDVINNDPPQQALYLDDFDYSISEDGNISFQPLRDDSFKHVGGMDVTVHQPQFQSLDVTDLPQHMDYLSEMNYSVGEDNCIKFPSYKDDERIAPLKARPHCFEKNMVLTSSQESVTHTAAHPSYGYSCSESWGQSNNNNNVSYQTYHEGLNDCHGLNDENTTNSIPTNNQWNYYDFSSC